MKPNYEFVENVLDQLLEDKFIYHWVVLVPGQYRINDALDIYPKHKKWHSLATSKRGKYYDLLDFVAGYFNPELRNKLKP